MIRHSPIAALLALLVLPVAAIPACREGTPAPRAGERLFSFDYTRVQTFEVLRNDPQAGAWNARLEKKGEHWMITTAPGGDDHPDRFGNSGFIQHLLDALSSLRVTGAPQPGPARAFGLERPPWVFRWNVGGATHELRIGDEAREGLGRFVLTGEENAPVVTAGGAALGLAARITDFASIRQPWVAVWTADDVFDVKISRTEGSGRREFYAERRAGGWVDRRDKQVPGVDEWLNRILHLRIRRYIPAPEASGLFQSLQLKPMLRVDFGDRLGNQRWIQAGGSGPATVAIVSDRAGAAFEIAPEDLKLFSPPSPGR